MNRPIAVKLYSGPARRAASRTALAAGCVVAVAAVAGPGTAGYSRDRSADTLLAWPLQAEPGISSNYCEYREGHLHAGIDIRTFGTEGVPCLAAGGGYVSRLRASSTGYGKALYVQLDSGETLVYAHLAEFEPRLERELQKVQSRNGSFDVDIRFPRGRFPVERGDVVAYSGSTGGTPPHLHFEIRDVGENPLNPLSHGFALDDRMPPVIERVEFTPLSPAARINGRCWPVELEALRVDAVDEGRFAVRDTLYFVDAVGVSVEAFDRLNGRSGRLAPYRFELRVDGSLVADVRLERFSFSHADQVDFVYDISRVRLEKAYFFQLFPSEGETMWNRQFGDDGGLTLLSPRPVGRTADGSDSLHVGTVVAYDVAGNRAVLSFEFYSGTFRPLPREAWERGRIGAGRDLPGFFFRNGFVSTRHALANERLPAPRVSPGDLNAARRIDGYRLPSVYSAGDLLDGPIAVGGPDAGAGGEVYLLGIEEGRPTSVNLPDLQAQLIVGARSLYADQVFYAAAGGQHAKAANPGELVPLAAPIRIGPYSAALRADVEIRFLVSQPDSTTAIFRLNERKLEWVFYPSIVDRDVVSTTARRPGVYAVFSDGYAPRIRRPFVRTWTSYATGEALPEIVIPIDDAGSGVDHEKTAVYLAETEQIAYWDSRSKKLFVVVRDPNIMGPRTISVVAVDKIGNRSQVETTIDIQATSRTRDNE